MHWREFQSLQLVVELGERFISYVDQGAGMPVLLLRVPIPDLLGFGYSDKRDCFDRSIARQAEMIDAWMEEMHVERAHIIGHDIGGGVALRLATLFPHRVVRLCVLNTVCYDSWPGSRALLHLGHPTVYHKLSTATTFMLLKLAVKQGFATSPDAELLYGLLAPYATEVGRLSLIRNAAALNTNLTTEISLLLGQVKAPTLILWGEDDTFQPIKYGERLAWDIPEARLVCIQGAHHFVMFDQRERVTEQLLTFLGV
jgi:pimeloyl-ACP methyl ester carboxylesterase